MDDLGRDVRAGIVQIDAMIHQLWAAEQRVAAAEGLASEQHRVLAGHRDVVGSLTSLIAGLLDARRGLNWYLADVGLEPASQLRCDGTIGAGMRVRVILASSVGPVDGVCEAVAYLGACVLPDPPGGGQQRQGTADTGVSYCEALAIVADVLATVADVVNGPASLAVQHVAERIQQPFWATGVDVAMAVAGATVKGKTSAETVGPLVSQQLLGVLPDVVTPGLGELKLMAALFRAAGVIACMAAGRLRQCPCLPPLLSNVGTTTAGLADGDG
ncbi:hypothetical protein [Actinoplanes sp. NPDC026670]|uniref:hypothetical protein n=1 Tax=Actinoplanes sp. NPDC026670 TaxID=3154700 RepID=UPI0033D25990